MATTSSFNDLRPVQLRLLRVFPRLSRLVQSHGLDRVEEKEGEDEDMEVKK